MLIFSRPWRQLNHWRRTIKHLPTPVQNKVVVRCNKGKGNTKRGEIPLRKEHRVLVPSKSSRFNLLTVVLAVSKQCSITPVVALLSAGQRPSFGCVQFIREETANFWAQRPVTNNITSDEGG